MLNRPLIGISANHCAENEGKYFIRENYIAAIESLGAIVILLPHTNPELAAMCDGVILSGGSVSVDTKMFGEENVSDLRIDTRRSSFDRDLFLTCMKYKIPILGICLGMQLMNVAMGGSLIQKLSIKEPHDGVPGEKTAHKILITEGSFLSDIFLGEKTIAVNSKHEQAVDRVGAGLLISATEPTTRVIEAIEFPNHPFCIGAQWHPEYLSNEQYDKMLLSAFCDAAKKYMTKGIKCA